MSLSFRNATDASVFVAFCRFTPAAGDNPGADWTNIGWYRVEPGTSREVFCGDLDQVNRYWYYHARSPAVGRVWSGLVLGCVKVPGPFDIGEGDTSAAQEQAGFREIDIGDHEDVEITLTTPAEGEL